VARQGASAPLAALRGGVRTLYPGYFALVMGTGIVSIATVDHALLSAALMWVDAAAYVVLVALLVWRAVAFRAELGADLRNPAKAFGIFTVVAATNVLGTRLTMAGALPVGCVLLVVGVALWLLLGYGLPWSIVGTARRPVVAAANGTWFIWAVATQSVAVLTASLEPQLPDLRRELALLAVSCWAVGTFLYLAVGGLVAVRLLIYDVGPDDLTPPYWVAMGAAAITVVAGVRINRMAAAPALLPTGGLIAGISVLFWAFATWLIPLLLAVGWRRHVKHRIPLRYEPALWSIVFPLGMYAVASRTLGTTLQLPIVTAIGSVQVWVALAVWVVVFVSMVTHLIDTARKPVFSRLQP
jgi:tellurite resistance protein TehA-like permease